MAENEKGIVMPETLRLAFDDYCNGCDIPKLKLDNLEVEDGFCVWHNHYTLYCENREACERVRKKMTQYEAYFKQVSSLNDCNNCGKKSNCEYEPRVGELTRINCPLWREKDGDNSSN